LFKSLLFLIVLCIAMIVYISNYGGRCRSISNIIKIYFEIYFLLVGSLRHAGPCIFLEYYKVKNTFIFNAY